MKKCKLKKNNKGITLISLVVTIIVILILASLSISTLMGQNGILTRVSEAKIKTEEAQLLEELQIAITSLAMNYYNSNHSGTLADYIFNNVDKLKNQLGDSNVSVNETAKTITYKGKTFAVANDGT